MTRAQIETTFLQQSNLIEREPADGEAFKDASDAWLHVRDLDKLSIYDVLDCHRILMRSRTTIPDSEKGAFRTHDVSVGFHQAPSWRSMPTLMQDFMHRLNNSQRVFGSKEVQRSVRDKESRNYHVDFEKIHPFADGNGRIGRILWNWQRLRFKLVPGIIYEKKKGAYYEWFN